MTFSFYFTPRIEKELELPALPEMLFGATTLKLQNKDNEFVLLFSSIDALRLVDNKRDLMKVAVAENWQKERSTILIRHCIKL